MRLGDPRVASLVERGANSSTGVVISVRRGVLSTFPRRASMSASSRGSIALVNSLDSVATAATRLSGWIATFWPSFTVNDGIAATVDLDMTVRDELPPLGAGRREAGGGRRRCRAAARAG
jgi:hypothetical protein